MNTRRSAAFLAILGLAAGFPTVAGGQSGTPTDGPLEWSDPYDLGPRHISELDAWRLAALPTDRNLRVDGGIPPLDTDAKTAFPDAGPPPDFKSLLRPRVDFFVEHEPAVDGVEIGAFDLAIKMPLYPIFGPPPPLITSGYSFTRIDSPAPLDLPAALHEFSLGVAWMRRINEQWMARLMVGGAFASDLRNASADAWQIRGGGFAVYQPNERWKFAFGALATGRDDLPVIPAVGAIWTPSRYLEVNLMMPSPRIALLLAEAEHRQHWVYFGGGISGGTWAYKRESGLRDRLSYREWRLVLGWESKPPQAPGAFGSAGTRFNAEVGWVLGRDFEFDSAAPDISLGSGLLLRAGCSF